MHSQRERTLVVLEQDVHDIATADCRNKYKSVCVGVVEEVGVFKGTVSVCSRHTFIRARHRMPQP